MNKKAFAANRILASLIDGFFMFLITVIVAIMPSITFFNEIKDGKFIAIDLFWFVFSLVASFLVWILYLAVPAYFFKFATVGMKLTHLSFDSYKDKDIKFSNVLFREAAVVCGIVLSLGLTIFADLFAIFSNKEGKTFFDY